MSKPVKTKSVRGRGGQLLLGAFLGLLCAGVLWFFLHVTTHQGLTKLHQAAWKGDLERISNLLDSGAEIDAIDDRSRLTPLGVAAANGREEAVELLLKRGADPNKATPLERALTARIAELLLEYGADVEKGHPLIQAANSGNREVLRQKQDSHRFFSCSVIRAL